MPIDKTKCCKTHTEEKEESGECCRTKSIHGLAVTNPTKTYKELEKIKSGVCIIGAMKHDRR